MGQLTRQDIQPMLDAMKNRILDRVATRQDIQSLTEASRDRIMAYAHDLVQIQQQNIMRRTDVQNSQLTKRVAVLEARMLSLEQELRLTRQAMERISEQQPGTQRAYVPKQSSVPPEQLYTGYSFQPE
jgi:hypothetical protein